MILIKSFKRGKSMIYLREQKKHDIWTRWTLTLVLLFLNLFSLHFLLCWHQGFVWQKPASKISNNVLCSHDFHIWFKGNKEILDASHSKGLMSYISFFFLQSLKIINIPCTHCVQFEWSGWLLLHSVYKQDRWAVERMTEKNLHNVRNMEVSSHLPPSPLSTSSHPK